MERKTFIERLRCCLPVRKAINVSGGGADGCDGGLMKTSVGDGDSDGDVKDDDGGTAVGSSAHLLAMRTANPAHSWPETNALTRSSDADSTSCGNALL